MDGLSKIQMQFISVELYSLKHTVTQFFSTSSPSRVVYDSAFKVLNEFKDGAAELGSNWEA